MNNTENELLFLKEQIKALTDDMSKLRLEIVSLISDNDQLHTALDISTYWLLNIAIKNNIGFDCLKKNRELLGEHRYAELVESAEEHIKHAKEFLDGWKKNTNN
jgi:hypothetical protein